MKGDLACVIQDKLALEERLQKNNEMLKALQAVSQSIFSMSNTYEQITMTRNRIYLDLKPDFFKLQEILSALFGLPISSKNVRKRGPKMSTRGNSKEG